MKFPKHKQLMTMLGISCLFTLSPPICRWYVFFALYIASTHAKFQWIMSDRAIPRSFRMMQGFGVHTFRLINEEGKSTFVKYHWTPHLGTHGLVWDEALKLNGQDPDFHRRDLWDAIEAGAYPKYELGVQIVKEEDEHKFDFDLLDATKVSRDICLFK